MKDVRSNYNIYLLGTNENDKITLLKKITKEHRKKFLDNQKRVCMFEFQNNSINLINLPTIPSLRGFSNDKITVKKQIINQHNSLILVVGNPFNLKQNINLTLQALKFHQKIIIVVYLNKKANKLIINRLGLVYDLGIPIVFIYDNQDTGIKRLEETIITMLDNRYPLPLQPINNRLKLSNTLRLAKQIYMQNIYF